MKYSRKGIYNFKHQTSCQKVKNMNHFVCLSFYFGAKNGSPAQTFQPSRFGIPSHGLTALPLNLTLNQKALNCQRTPERMKESREIYAHYSLIQFIKTNSCFSAKKSSKRVRRGALLNKTTNNLYAEDVVYSNLLLVLTQRRVTVQLK